MKLFNLPNLLTCGNLLCGCMATVIALTTQNLAACALWIILGAVFDFFDGMTARALGISGPIGKELDSLADVVTFGIAPAAIAYVLLCAAPQTAAPAHDLVHNGVDRPLGEVSPALLAFLMAAFSALRLAKFNCDTRQASSFIGLPTPANALFWAGLPSVAVFPPFRAVLSPIILWMLVAVMSFLLVCELPMFSLKFKRGHTSWHDLGLQYTFLLLCAGAIVVGFLLSAPLASLSLIVVIYIAMSLVAWALGKGKASGRPA